MNVFKKIVLSTTLLAASTSMTQAAEQAVGSVHFLVPGGAGGGWDGTARGTGEALTKSGLLGKATYENMSGGGGGKAAGYLIENAKSNESTLMVNSTPIIIRSLTGVFPQSFRDLTMVAGVIGDYAALVVSKDSPYDNFQAFVDGYKKEPAKFSIGGGSVPGGMDHLVTAMIMQSAGVDPLEVKYVPYDTGGKAMPALLSGEITALATGLSEAIALAESGEVKIIGITAAEKVADYPNVLTFKEQGFEVEFINWRGFFGPPGLSEEKLAEYKVLFDAMYNTPEWEEVRTRNGWVNIYNYGADFSAFLEKQDKEIGDLMKQLGFL